MLSDAGEKRCTVLKYFLLLLGVILLAPFVIAGLALAIPAFPFLIAGWVVYKLIRSKRSSSAISTVDEERWVALQLRGRSLPIAPVVLGLLVSATALQIKFAGFDWRVDLWLGGSTLVVAALWWLQHRIVHRRRERYGRGPSGVARHDLYRLLEIERTTDSAERLMLIARELNRLTQEALRADPTHQEAWPAVAELRTLRDQVRVLRSCLKDSATRNRHEIEGSVPFSPLELKSGIDGLDAYLSQFMRVRLIGQHDLEQLRVLVRDQSQLRGMQDGLLERFQQIAPVPIAG